jgi:hypothetical protein
VTKGFYTRIMRSDKVFWLQHRTQRIMRSSMQRIGIGSEGGPPRRGGRL